MSLHRLAWAAALALAVSACTIKTTDGDAGASDAAPQTVGDQCAVIAREYCQQGASRCGMGTATPLDQCISAAVAACCLGSMCNEKSLSPESAVTACQQSIDLESCYALSIGTTPDSCVGVPRVQ